MSLADDLAAARFAQPEPARDPGLELVPGGSWILDTPDEVPSVWGEGTSVVWSSGEPFYIVGPAGVGKSTIAQQLILKRLGVGEPTFLDLPVTTDERPVIYIAADRANQVRRSLRRMVTEEHRDLLDRRLLVRKGPPNLNVEEDAEELARWARDHGAGCVVVDSAKDLCHTLEEGRSGAAFNGAMQHLVTAGIEVLVIHHERKNSGGASSTLAETYGSTWLTAGAGSVVSLDGKPSDAIVKLRHLKVPVEKVGPWKLLHDHPKGETTFADPPVNPLDVLRRSPKGLTARDLATIQTEGGETDRAAIERGRRALDHLVASQLAIRLDGDKTKGVPTVYLPAVSA
jgi:replicative DNA helicase